MQAQEKHKDNAYLIYTLGRDTTLIGHYQLKGDDFVMTVVVKNNLEVHKLKGSFFPSGENRYVEGYAYKPIIGKDSLLLQTYKLYTRNDSTFTEQKIGDNKSVFGYSGKGMIHMGITPLGFFNAIYANYAPAKSGDSLLSSHLLFGTKDPLTIKRINKNTVTVSGGMMGGFTVHLNKMGKPSSIDAIGSSWNVKGMILPYLNLDSIIHAEALREQLTGIKPNVNIPDSVQATISSTSIKINYSRPSMRGRAIFGGSSMEPILANRSQCCY